MDPRALDNWFVDEVLPLEGALMRFLRRNWRTDADILDLRQEVYTRVCEAAMQAEPLNTKAFVFATARNLLIDRMRHARVVPLEVAVDLEGWGQGVDEVTPDRHLTARDELRRLQAGLAQLPARCREVVVLRKIQGFSQREVAARMGIREDTVERQTAHGMRALADFMLGGSGRIRRGAAGHRKAAP
ncbi:MAG TPA: sigma-70 family RNA polymerase sigma factor [Caulobacteraceae bacterium]|nr:sigma-70 family RNA polymerase sigma factor [Caulobacteraceae bacterium]